MGKKDVNLERRMEELMGKIREAAGHREVSPEDAALQKELEDSDYDLLFNDKKKGTKIFGNLENPEDYIAQVKKNLHEDMNPLSKLEFETLDHLISAMFEILRAASGFKALNRNGDVSGAMGFFDTLTHIVSGLTNALLNKDAEKAMRVDPGTEAISRMIASSMKN